MALAILVRRFEKGDAAEQEAVYTTFIAQRHRVNNWKLCEMLLADEQDLMHKACGWMLRELAKRDETALVGFIQTHYSAMPRAMPRTMPRTMLCYAIEKFDEPTRKALLAGDFSGV